MNKECLQDQVHSRGADLNWKQRQCIHGTGEKGNTQMWVHRQVHRRRKWQPTPVFLPETSHGQRKPGRLQSLGSQRVRHDLAPELACSIMLMKNRRSSLFCSNFLHEIGSQAIIGSEDGEEFLKV